ncbi:serine/threonine-protein kinase ATM [Striga asiatica]|uniref:Serine/threonine-protein kinase ATM n=1 Tax=Striga asiatica TaxID=4170 RepID=A0A5A7RI04_STRAF|nr:serine/threonine-protein kinase ATM [Striga asiatica]
MPMSMIYFASLFPYLLDIKVVLVGFDLWVRQINVPLTFSGELFNGYPRYKKEDKDGNWVDIVDSWSWSNYKVLLPDLKKVGRQLSQRSGLMMSISTPCSSRVMEQFFGLVNTFLRDTWRRRLKIHTYKVVPFTPSAGVQEWVNGTFPLGEYLIGSSRNGGAHGFYGVGDWTFMDWTFMETNKPKASRKSARISGASHALLLLGEVFTACGLVGYIVGLGDRHSMNILINQATAEVVHIDLGVAFEQGLMLKTPERVSFRLTRDIIDGMGVTGGRSF